MSPRLFSAPLKNRAFIGAIVSLRRITRTIITNSKLARTLAMPSDQQAATARGAAVPPPICPAHGAECANQHTLTPLQPLQEPVSVELMEEEIPATSEWWPAGAPRLPPPPPTEVADPLALPAATRTPGAPPPNPARNNKSKKMNGSGPKWPRRYELKN